MKGKIREFKYEHDGTRYLIHADSIAVGFYRNNRLHRSNGPAVIWPAVIWPAGSAVCYYYLDDKRQTKEEHGRKNKGIQI